MYPASSQTNQTIMCDNEMCSVSTLFLRLYLSPKKFIIRSQIRILVTVSI